MSNYRSSPEVWNKNLIQVLSVSDISLLIYSTGNGGNFKDSDFQNKLNPEN